jgi:hypothetical protein
MTPYSIQTLLEPQFEMAVTYPPENLIHTQQSHTILKYSPTTGLGRYGVATIIYLRIFQYGVSGVWLQYASPVPPVELLISTYLEFNADPYL